MGPQYHLMIGSFIANARPYNLRERRLVMLAALAPDLDGVFIWNAELWEKMHHTFSNNIFFAAAVAIGFALYNRGRRLELFVVCFLTAFLQELIDVITNDPSWKQCFLWPASGFDFALGHFINWDGLAFTLVWVVQGSLMVLILAGVVILYRKTGRTFIELVSVNLDRFVTDFITFPFTNKCEVCGARAYYRDRETGGGLCPDHAGFNRDLTFTIKQGDNNNGD